jgi:hypothetical protein
MRVDSTRTRVDSTRIVLFSITRRRVKLTRTAAHKSYRAARHANFYSAESWNYKKYKSDCTEPLKNKKTSQINPKSNTYQKNTSKIVDWKYLICIVNVMKEKKNQCPVFLLNRVDGGILPAHLKLGILSKLMLSTKI